MRRIALGIMAVMIAIAFPCVTGCSNEEHSQQTSDNKAVQYTCSMHPEVVQDKPGKCPKCGMDLVVKK
jgi:hypothetical protein